MTKDMKKWLGNRIMKLGQYSVGKSHYFGMYDPKIPEALKEEVEKREKQR